MRNTAYASAWLMTSIVLYTVSHVSPEQCSCCVEQKDGYLNDVETKWRFSRQDARTVTVAKADAGNFTSLRRDPQSHFAHPPFLGHKRAFPADVELPVLLLHVHDGLGSI